MLGVGTGWAAGERWEVRMAEPAEPAEPGRAGDPAGDVYDWMQRGLALLAAGHAAAAAELLEHALRAEPETPAVREALARAQFDAGRYPAAGTNFTWLVERDPTDHYAHYGAGLAAQRTHDPVRAVELLALAAAMRPDLQHYQRALRAARATVARRSA